MEMTLSRKVLNTVAGILDYIAARIYISFRCGNSRSRCSGNE